MADTSAPLGLVVSTAVASLFTGYGLGVWATRGYLISPELTAERHGNYNDPVESAESDIDEDDTVLDHAPNWANGVDADKRQGLSARRGGAATAAAEGGRQSSREKSTPEVRDTGEECKLVLVVRTDLGMTKGKIAAQCSHATLACYKRLLRGKPGSNEAGILARWERLGQAKIAVQIKTQDEILELRARARSMGLAAEVVQDAGRTQIEAGSITVLGVGPAPKSVVDKITGHLKLL